MSGSRFRSKKLTARERAVIALVAEGLTSTEIGPVFHRSAWTVDQWRSSAKRKLGARGPAHLVHLAYQAGVLPFEPAALAVLLRRSERNAA